MNTEADFKRDFEITWIDSTFKPEEHTFIESFYTIDDLKKWLDHYLNDKLVLVSVKELVVSKIDIDL